MGIAVLDTVITSSLFDTFKAFKAMISASVPLLTPRPYLDLFIFINFFSKDFNSLPKNNILLLKTLSKEYKIFLRKNKYSFS